MTCPFPLDSDFAGMMRPGHDQSTPFVAQTSKSAVSRVSKPAAGATCRWSYRLGSRRHGRFGNLRYEVRRHLFTRQRSCVKIRPTEGVQNFASGEAKFCHQETLGELERQPPARRVSGKVNIAPDRRSALRKPCQQSHGRTSFGIRLSGLGVRSCSVTSRSKCPSNPLVVIQVTATQGRQRIRNSA